MRAGFPNAHSVRIAQCQTEPLLQFDKACYSRQLHRSIQVEVRLTFNRMHAMRKPMNGSVKLLAALMVLVPMMGFAQSPSSAVSGQRTFSIAPRGTIEQESAAEVRAGGGS